VTTVTTFLTNVPKWCSQWILLATDTEFGKPEARKLRETGQWSRFYRLKGIDSGETRIEAIEASEAMSLLAAEE